MPKLSGNGAEVLTNHQLDDDLESIVLATLRLPDVQTALDEHAWSVGAIESLRRDLMNDLSLRQRVRARYTVVAERATTLDEHAREEPPWWEPGWTPDRAAKIAGLLAVVYPLLVSVAIAWLFFPSVVWLRILVITAVMVGMYHFEPGARFALRHAVSGQTWYRLQWGRKRRQLRLGIVRLRYDWKNAVRDEIMLPEVRERINARVGRHYNEKLTIRDASGLRSTDDMSFLLTTGAHPPRDNDIDEFRRSHPFTDAERRGPAQRQQHELTEPRKRFAERFSCRRGPHRWPTRQPPRHSLRSG